MSGSSHSVTTSASGKRGARKRRAASCRGSPMYAGSSDGLFFQSSGESVLSGSMKILPTPSAAARASQQSIVGDGSAGSAKVSAEALTSQCSLLRA